MNDIEYDEMHYLMSRCSICFDRALDFCLQKCKDQFCRVCFEKYIAELLKSSWGISKVKIRCPVCSDPLFPSEWGHYVSSHLLHKFYENNKPYKLMARFCDCGEEVNVVTRPVFNESAREGVLEQVSSTIETITSSGYYPLSSLPDILVPTSIAEQSITEIYNQSILPVLTVVQSNSFTSIVTRGMKHKLDILHEHVELLGGAGSRLISLECDEDKWCELQFIHAKNFPIGKCQKCTSTLCFHCGTQPYHHNLDCLQHLRSLTHSPSSNHTHQESLTISYKLNNAKPCPRCYSLITRDEGCNKVECGYCGYVFCYECLNAFEGGGCGFYKCVLDKEKSTKEEEGEEKEKEEVGVVGVKADIKGKMVDDRPELGVPSITAIENWLAKSSGSHLF